MRCDAKGALLVPLEYRRVEVQGRFERISLQLCQPLFEQILKRVLEKNIATVLLKSIERRYLLPHHSIATAYDRILRLVGVALCFLKKCQPQIFGKKPGGGCADRR